MKKILILLSIFLFIVSCNKELIKDDKVNKKTKNSEYDMQAVDYYLKAYNFKELGNIYGAIVEFQNSYNISKDPYIKKELSECYHLLNQNDKALEELNIAIDAIGETEELLKLKLKILYAMKDYHGYLTTSDKLIKVNPKNIDYYYYKTDVLLQMKSFTNIFETLNQALKQDLNEYMLTELYKKKSAYAIMGNYLDTAAVNYKRYLKRIDPNDIDVLTQLRKIYLTQNNYDSAFVYQKKIIKTDSTNHDNYSLGFLILREGGKKEEAVKFLEEALLKFPESFDLNYLLGQRYAREGEVNKAEKVLSGILSGKDTDLMVYNELAVMFDKAGDKNKALKIYKEAHKNFPHDVALLNNYAYILSELNKDLEKAYEMSKETLEVVPENSSYLDTFGWINYRLEKYEEAEQYILKAIKLNEDKEQEYILYDHLADIQLKLGKNQKALENYKKSYELNKNDTVLKKIQELER